MLKIKLKDLLQGETQTDVKLLELTHRVSSQTKRLNARRVQHTMEIITLLEDEQLAQHTQETQDC